MEGIFDALHQSVIDNKAESYIRKLAKTVFEQELTRSQSRASGIRPTPSTLLSCFLDSIPHALAREQPEHASKACTVVAAVVQPGDGRPGSRR
jgi:transformation/transcription domain-associated protein